MKLVTPDQIIVLVNKLPKSEMHIYGKYGKHTITNEWLCGGFAGRGFTDVTLEKAAQQLIDYLYEHLNHNSMVGNCVMESGFPDLEKVYRYCKPKEVEEV